jgi:hypothetical protein
VGGIGCEGLLASSDALSFGERSSSDCQAVTYDTQLHGNQRDANYGADATGWVDDSPQERRVTLFRFDLSAIPADTQVHGASLLLVTGGSNLSNSTGTVQFHELLESWDEGDEIGGAGVANWDEREAGVPWSTSGAGTQSHGSDELATFQGGALNTEYTVQLPLELIQRWIQNRDRNYGMIASTTAEDGTEMALSEHPDPSRRPELTVRLVPEP